MIVIDNLYKILILNMILLNIENWMIFKLII